MIEYDEGLVQVHRKLFHEMYDNNYFIDRFEKVCMDFDGMGNSYALQDKRTIRLFWFEFLCEIPNKKLSNMDLFNKIANVSLVN